MKIFGNEVFVGASGTANYSTAMKLTHPLHMMPPDSPYSGSGKNIIALEKTIGAEHVTRAGTFQHAMLQALDKVSGAQHHASGLATQAFIDPGSVDVHDVTVAQATAWVAGVDAGASNTKSNTYEKYTGAVDIIGLKNNAEAGNTHKLAQTETIKEFTNRLCFLPFITAGATTPTPNVPENDIINPASNAA